jgi:hypothetical protein
VRVPKIGSPSPAGGRPAPVTRAAEPGPGTQVGPHTSLAFTGYASTAIRRGAATALGNTNALSEPGPAAPAELRARLPAPTLTRVIASDLLELLLPDCDVETAERLSDATLCDGPKLDRFGTEPTEGWERSVPSTEDFELLGRLVAADIKAGEPETFTLVARPAMGGYEFASRRGWPDEALAPSHLRVDELEEFGWVRVTSSTTGKNRIFAVTSAGREAWNRYAAQ